ncbi:MAG: ferritin-like domain-containing protein [Rhodocyclaceae bacterium]|nr:MAG: ferritin-like domain-containing protein [Gammaproteobacteria bacterium]TXG78104.1 MAG: ferritin-like domain-containing protein [Rhodocyclaceae bacterium]
MHVIDLHSAARQCLEVAQPELKCTLTRQFVAEHRAGNLVRSESCDLPQPIANPGRPDRPRLVDPRSLPKRGMGSIEGRAALIHAIAHIEFNAINLAWDAVYRFRDMPEAFYADWVAVAADEARHFGMLETRLAELGFSYGDFDAHNGLWEMSVLTADSCLRRMALVPRVLEARGLDVTPGMIARLRSANDHQTADILEIILREEVAHVAAGSRWFAWCCEREGLDPRVAFSDMVGLLARGSLKGPFNVDARLRAGFTQAELAQLRILAA